MIISGLLVISGCQSSDRLGINDQPSQMEGGELIAQQSDDYIPLKSRSPRRRPIRVAVYEMPDLTGATRRNPQYADLSRAVSQGAEALVIDALKSTGNASWFLVLERKNLQALTGERSIRINQINQDRQIRHTRSERQRIAEARRSIAQEVAALKTQLEKDYANPRTVAQKNLPPKEVSLANLRKYESDLIRQIEKPRPFSAFERFKPIKNLVGADYILMGSIFSYESDLISAGAGVRYQNKGIYGEYRKDTIGINLRLVQVQTGEILSNVNVSQSVASRKVQGDFLNYVTLTKILEIEAGAVVNEPKTLALDAAIRMGIHLIITKMEEAGKW
jgi:curli biogenesis system outer membrane secretion channel CsgG